MKYIFSDSVEIEYFIEQNLYSLEHAKIYERMYTVLL